jgi:hypothetical protein
MSDSLTKAELTEVFETMLAAQLRALRALSGKRRRAERLEHGRKRKSNISVVEDILRAADGPLHISEIIARAQRDFGVTLKRESIVSALTKKVLDRQIFRRTGRNEFDLLDRKENE